MSKNRLTLTTLLCLTMGSAYATPIIGDATGNGDFEAITGTPAVDAYPTSYMNNWHNLSGPETQTSGTATWGGADGLRATYVYKSFKLGNDTGHEVAAAGEAFTVSFKYYGFGGAAPYTGDNDIEAYLFKTTSGTVDDSTDWASDVTVLGTYSLPIEHTAGGTASDLIYTSVAADIGDSIFIAFGMNDVTPASFPRIDTVTLDVDDSGVTPPPPASTNLTIIAGSTGNADFEDGEPSASGAVPYDSTVNWFNASGAETINFTIDAQTSGSSQPNSRAAMPFQNRLQVNDTGHTVTSTGEVFNLSYDFGKMGGNWDGDEQMRTFLFTAAVPVDGSLTAASMTEYGSVLYSFPTNETWTSFVTNGFYTSTIADIGNTFYFGMEHKNPEGGTPFPRLDVIDLNVDIGGTTTNEPPVVETPPTAWSEFVTAYGLSGYYATDADNDGVSDRIEFAHGGNPTNAADTGVAPSLAYSNDTANFQCLETANTTNAGITYSAEWTDNLVSGAWQTAWISTNSDASAVPNYDEVEYQANGASHENQFFRNRIAPSTSRPNILFILADDLGYADVSFNHPYSGPNQTTAENGSVQISTPELDRLANSGAIFTSAYVVHPFCGPSRMGLMAGRYPHDFGGPFNLPDDSTGNYTDQGISTNETLISTMLQDSGYNTGIMGKWHLGQEPEFHPNVRGYDDFYGFLGGGILYWGPYKAGGWDYGRYPEHNGIIDTSLGSNDHITDVLTEKGNNFIVNAALTEDPFFLLMSYNAPHSVLVSGGRDQAKPEDLAAYADVPHQYRRNLCGLIRGMDRCIGELVQTLKDTGQYENTLIVFLSDNGGRTDQVGGFGDNGVLRGRKGNVTEGGFRVPMFMHWPGVIPDGVTYDHPVTALDFYPTFAHLAETDIPAGQNVVGTDIWDTMLNATDSRPGESIYTVTYSTSATSVGIRQDQWKAVKINNADWTLYNVETDIGETSDVSGANASVLSDLVSEGNSWSESHVQPLWWNNPASEATWNANDMPHYETVFVLP